MKIVFFFIALCPLVALADNDSIEVETDDDNIRKIVPLVRLANIGSTRNVGTSGDSINTRFRQNFQEGGYNLGWQGGYYPGGQGGYYPGGFYPGGQGGFYPGVQGGYPGGYYPGGQGGYYPGQVYPGQGYPGGLYPGGVGGFYPGGGLNPAEIIGEEIGGIVGSLVG